MTMASMATSLGLSHVFHQLKSRSAGILFTRSINTSAIFEKETFNVYNLRTRRSHSHDLRDKNGLLSPKCVIWSQDEPTSIRQFSYFGKYSLATKLESKGFTKEQADGLAEAITTNNDENGKKLDKIQKKIDEEFDSLKWKIRYYYLYCIVIWFYLLIIMCK